MATAHLRAVLEGFAEANRELERVASGVDKVASTQKGATTAANDAKRASEGFTDALADMGSKAAIIGAAVSAASAAIGFFGVKLYDAIKATTDLGDELNALRQTTGISAESLSSLTLAFETNDLSMKEGAASIERFNKKLYDAQQGNKEASRVFQALGLDVKKFGGDSEAALIAIADKFSQFQDGAGKTALAIDLFGRGGAKLIPVLNEGADGLAKFRAEARAAGIVMTDETAKAADDLNDSLKVLSAYTRGFWQELATPFVKAFADIASGMRQARLEGDGFFGAMLGGLQKLAQYGFGVGSEQQELSGVNGKLAGLYATQKILAGKDQRYVGGQLSGVNQQIADLEARRDQLNAVLTINQPTGPVSGKPGAPNLPGVAKGGRDTVAEGAMNYAKAVQQEYDDAWKYYNQYVAKQDKADEDEWKKEVANLRRIGEAEVAHFNESAREYEKSMRDKQKINEDAANVAIQTVRNMTETERGQHMAMLETLRVAYAELGKEGEEAVKKIEAAQRDVAREAKRHEEDVWGVGATWKSVSDGIDQVIRGTRLNMGHELAEVLKGHQSVTAGIKKVWDSMVSGILDKVAQFAVDEGFKLLKQLLTGEGADTSWASSLINVLTGGFDNLLSIGTSLFDKLASIDWGGIASSIGGIFSGGGGIFGGGGDLLGGALGFVGDLFGGFFASGTDQIVSRPTMVMVGEGGPERLQVTPIGTTGMGGRGGTTVNISGFSLIDNYQSRRLALQLRTIMG
jgi:hypothetical protein